MLSRGAVPEKNIHAETNSRNAGKQSGIADEIRKSEKKAIDNYLSITNLTGDIIVHADKNGKWTFLNDVACDFWGNSRDELLGKSFDDYIHPGDVEKAAAAIQKMMKSKKILKGFTNRQNTPDGWRDVEWNASPCFDEKGA